MVSFSLLSSMARRRAMPIIQQQQRRGMALGGHHGPPPDWQGVDKVVRSYFPQDYQLAIAILSFYGGITVLYKIKSAISGGGKKEEPVAAPKKAAAPASTTGVPSIESPAFESFVETEAFEKLLENEDQLSKLVESA